jgi:hypothetical protein
MTQHSISAAAPLVGKDRKTLYRMIKEGKLSATVSPSGQQQIETSELLRVFGEIKQQETLFATNQDSLKTVSMPQHKTPKSTRVELLEAELELVREQLKLMEQQLKLKEQRAELEMRHARELIAVREEQIQDVRKALLLLEAPRSQASPDPAPKGFWTKPRKLF